MLSEPDRHRALFFPFQNMKILFVGASGAIGGGVLSQCLAHPHITAVVAFVRRELPPDAAGNSKLQCVVKKDFANWEDGELRAHADAAGMVWYVSGPAPLMETHMLCTHSRGSNLR
jgi:hypothetical protein